MRITQGLTRAASVRPDGVATIDGARRRSWREVEQRVARLAAALRSIGIGEGDRFAVLSQNCDRFYETYYAAAWAGAVIVPLNTRLALPETEFQLDDCGAKALFFSREFADMAADLKRQNGSRTFVGLDGDESPADHAYERLVDEASPIPDAGRGGDDLAAIFYTGGTTGLPKGVMLGHRNLTAMATNLIMAIKIDEDCVNLHSAPMFHLADIGTFMTTMVAGTHVFVRRLVDTDMLDAIAEHRVTHVFTVPAVIDRLAVDGAGRDLSALKFLGYGGAPMPPAILDRARARFPHVEFGQGFGMTEMGAATFLGPRHHRSTADPEKLTSAGQPCFGYEIRIVGPEGNELPRRSVGEIVGRGDNVMLGYWNRPEETASALRDGWMHSGDIGFMDEGGFLYINDRLKDMIVTGAENVYSIEVEHAISRHPAVAECAVVGIPDERWGEGVHAIVVLKPGAALTFEELVQFCRQRIAGYKCPRSLEIHAHPLPRSAAGKIRKVELRAPYWAGRDRSV
jgi:acyl-CoA synthetase (AMP-forming)/AMP-acid ligase II